MGSCHLNYWWWRYWEVKSDDDNHWNFEALLTVAYDGPPTRCSIMVMTELQSTTQGDQTSIQPMSFETIIDRDIKS